MGTSREHGRKLSVLHVVPYYPPDRIGGLGEVVAHLHGSLLRKGHCSTVLTAGTSRSEDHILRVARSPTAFVLACARYLPLTKRADIVHVHHGEALGLLTAMKVIGVDTPVLLTLHASPEGIRRSLGSFTVEGRRISADQGWLRRTLRLKVRYGFDRGAMRLANRLSFICRSAARDFLSRGRADHARIIYNGLPEPADVEVEERPDPVELLFVGSYSVRKRVQVLPFVLARVRGREPEARMRLIGFRREDHPEFLRLAREAGVEDAFLFEGKLPSRDLPPYYRAARVLLVPSAYEGLPIVVMEGFQNSLPCVATRVSGLPEIIEDGRNGYLVEVDRPDQMAEAALRLLRDDRLRRSMGTRGQAVVAERFSVVRQAEEYIELYEEMRRFSNVPAA